MSKKNTPIDALLADTPVPSRPNVVADNAPLAEAIQVFLALMEAEDERVRGMTLKWFYTKKLQAEYGGPVYFGTIRKYVAQVLRRDYTTGRAL